MFIIKTDHYESRFSSRGLMGNFEKAAERAYKLGHVRVNDTWVDAPQWFENTNWGMPFGEKTIWFGGYQFKTCYDKYAQEITITTVTFQFGNGDKQKKGKSEKKKK